MRAASRTIRRGGGVAHLVLSLALETGHESAAVPIPKALHFAKTRRLGRRRGLFLGMKLQSGLGRGRDKAVAALAAHRALGRHIFHLLKTAVWTFHTDLGRRRLSGHDVSQQ